MTFSSGVLGTMGALALLLSLVALAVALSNRQRIAGISPARSTPEPVPALRKPEPEPRQRAESAVPVESAGPRNTDNAGGDEPMVKITPAPANDEVAAVIAAAIAAYLGDEAARTTAAPVTHVTSYGVAGPVWKAAGREAVIGARQSMYGKGYRR